MNTWHLAARRAAVFGAVAAAACSDASIVAPTDGPQTTPAVTHAAQVVLSPRSAAILVGDTVRAVATVRSSSGASMAEVPQYRAVPSGVVTVSAAGIVVGRAAGTASVIAQVGTVADTMTVTVATAPPVAVTGLVQVRFVGGTPAGNVVAAFTAAANRLNGLMNSFSTASPVAINLGAGACDAAQPALAETVTGLLIIASVRPIDGAGAILGQAGPCVVRTGARGIPVVGIMAFDEADMGTMAQRGLLDGVILHEMMHVLGIGTLWGPSHQGLVADPDGADPLFRGQRATLAYGVFGALNADLGVPVENTGGPGTRGGHWRESVFRDELMTGWAGGAMQMSTVTLGALLDMGYDVDMSKADGYSLGSMLGGAIATTTTAPAGVHLGEVVLEPVARVDRSGKLQPF